MNKVTKMISYKYQEPEGLFKFVKSALVTLGYDIYKMRQIGFLFEARKRIDVMMVNANLNVNPINANLTLTLTSDSANLELIEYLSEELLQAIDDLIGCPSIK